MSLTLKKDENETFDLDPIMKQIVDLAPVNIMLADKNGKLLYMNQNSTKTLKSLQKYLPDSVDNLVGQSIDIFHKNPIHQKKIIANPKNLPLQSTINVGDQKLDLLVSPITNSEGEYVGPMVTWKIITERVKLVNDLTSGSKELSGSATKLIEVAENLLKNAEETSAQANSAATGSEEVSSGVQTVATNIEEMTASIKDISASTQKATKVTDVASQNSDEAKAMVLALGESSQDIGNIIKVISSIAQQTNLLALNATIEAARAGEAGKGFSVVANEVKELAKQTAKATEDITKKIEKIQSDSSSAVDSMSKVAEVINEVNSISTTIASAVEEQAASTDEVSRVVQQSAEAVGSISKNINEVSQLSKQTGSNADDTKGAAEEVEKIAKKLSELVKDLEV